MKQQFLITVILCLIFSTGIASGDSMQAEPGMDRPGGDFSKIVIQSHNPDDCAQACLEDSRCVAATYVTPQTFQGPEAWCRLKDNVPASSPDRNCTTFLKRGGGMQPPIDAEKIMITRDPAWSQHDLVFDGNYLVWSGRLPEGKSGYDQIMVYDIRTKTITPITGDEFTHSLMAAEGGRVLWNDLNGITLYDIPSRKGSVIMTTSIQDVGCPQISGNLLAWLDKRNVKMKIGGNSNYGLHAEWSGSPEIYLRDLTTNTDTRITRNDDKKGCPALSANWLAWTEIRNGSGYLSLYDIRTKKQDLVSVAIHDTVPLQTENNRIFWNEGENISYYDSTTGTIGQVSWKPLRHYSYSVSGSRIIWDGWYHTGNGLEVYDLGSDTIRLVNDSYDVYYPVAGKEYVAAVLLNPVYEQTTGNIVLYKLPESGAAGESRGKTTKADPEILFSCIPAITCAAIIASFKKKYR